MTVEPGGTSILLGTEGNNSPLMRVKLPAYAIAPKTPTVAPNAVAPNPQANGGAPAPQLDTLAAPEVAAEKVKPVGTGTWVSGALLILLAGGLIVSRLVQRRRRLRARHRRLHERQRV